LPDLALCNIPKRVKIYQKGGTIPNGHKYTKINQMSKIYQHLPLKDPRKMYPNLDFGHKFTIWQPCSQQLCVAFCCFHSEDANQCLRLLQESAKVLCNSGWILFYIFLWPMP
jgi:hypothetical protein